MFAGRRPTAGREMRQKAKTNSLLLRESFFSLRGVQDRPMSVATEFLESDYEDEEADERAYERAFEQQQQDQQQQQQQLDDLDDLEDYEHDYYGHSSSLLSQTTPTQAQQTTRGDTSPRRSLDSGQPSFTTVSSYDEVPTPRSGRMPGSMFSSSEQQQMQQQKAVEGPRGPHLFRISTLSAEFADALTLSPLTPHPGTMGFDQERTTTTTTTTAAASHVLPHGVTPLPPTPRRGRAASRDVDAPFRFASDDLDASRLASWSPECVAQWMLQAGLELSVCERFVENDITGGILITLKFADLKELGIQSFGLRTVVWDQIGVLKAGGHATQQSSLSSSTSASSSSSSSASSSSAARKMSTPMAAEPDTDIEEEEPEQEPERSVQHELRHILRGGETSCSPPRVADPRAEQQQLSASSMARERRREEERKTSPVQRQMQMQTQSQTPQAPPAQQTLRRRASSRRKKPTARLDDVISPLESVSIVGIEQVLPRPHQCSKGENCSKFRRYQRMLEAIRQEHPNADACGGIGGGGGGEEGSGPGVLVIAGDLGSLQSTPTRSDVFRPVSDALPSVVASSDVLGPGTLPPPVAAAPLHADSLRTLAARDPQDNVRQFLAFQQVSGGAEVPPTPPFELYPDTPKLPPSQQQQQQQQQQHYAPAAQDRLRALPRLAIPPANTPPKQQQQLPRSAVTASAAPTSGTSYTNTAIEESPDRDDRAGLTPTPTGLSSSSNINNNAGMVYRFGTPFTEVDVPVTSVPMGPIAREVSQSVPPDMSYRTGNGNNTGTLQRTMSRASARRPSFPVLPALAENPGQVPHQQQHQQYQHQHQVQAYPVHQRAASAIGYRRPPTAQGLGGGAAPVDRPLQPPPRVRYPWSSDRAAEKAQAPRSLLTAGGGGGNGAVKTTTVTIAPAASSSASLASASTAPSSSSAASLRSAASTAPTSASGSLLFGGGGSSSSGGISYQGAVKKRRTKMLRHEWHDRYVTLRGTRMAVHKDAASAHHDRTLEYIDIDDYAIACSASAASSRKLSAAFKAMHLRQGSGVSSGSGQADKADVAAFAFQLIPQDHRGGMRLRKRDSTVPGGASASASSASASVRTADSSSSSSSAPPPPPADAANGTGKTHHFAVKSRDDQIEWMRELMLAKAMRQKGEGFEVSVNGNMI